MWTSHLSSKLERISLPAPVQEKFKNETSRFCSFLSKVPFCLWVPTLEGVRGDTTPSTLNPLPSTLDRRPPATSNINRVVGVTVPLTDGVTFSSMRGSRGGPGGRQWGPGLRASAPASQPLRTINTRLFRRARLTSKLLFWVVQLTCAFILERTPRGLLRAFWDSSAPGQVNFWIRSLRGINWSLGDDCMTSELFD